MPQLSALKVRPQGIELLEGRVDTRLDRELAQQAPGEAVDGADGGVVQRVERRSDLHGVLCDGRARLALLKLLADTLAQLAGRLLGEGDRRDGAHIPRPTVRIEDGVDVPADEDLGLARSGSRLEEVGPCEVVDRVAATVVIDDLR